MFDELFESVSFEAKNNLEIVLSVNNNNNNNNNNNSYVCCLFEDTKPVNSFLSCLV
jgi:hypothetical protein